MAKKKKRGKSRNLNQKTRQKKAESTTKQEFQIVKTDFALNLIAAIIVFASAILFLVVPLDFSLITFPKAMLFAVLNVIIGAGMIMSTVSLKVKPREASVFMLVFSIISLIFPPHGFVIGPIIGIIGSLMVLAKLRKR